MSDLLIALIDSGHPGFLLCALVTNSLGFLGYGWNLWSLVARGKDILPLWMHIFYLAHDSSTALYCLQTAAAQGGYSFWFFTVYGYGLAAFSVQEIFVISHAVLQGAHRRDVWGDTATVGHAVGSVLAQTAAWVAIVDLAMSFFDKAGGEPLYDIFLFTNVCWALGQGEQLRRRTTREWCGGLGFQALSILTLVNTFAPWNMWVLARPDLYDTFWFYFTGVVCVGTAVLNFFWVRSLPSEDAGQQLSTGAANGKKRV